jgi:hypothetical protein
MGAGLMSKYEQRFRGYRDNCRFCSRPFRAETMIGIEAAVTEHETKCEPEQRAKAEREARAAAASAAQTDLFGKR